MSYVGDLTAGDTVNFRFTTRQFSTGSPFTLAGTPALRIYKDGSDTQSTAGITLTADADGVTGLNKVAIDTTADGTFYSNGSQFDVVIQAGTVDSVSVVGETVGRFTLGVNAKPTTAGRKINSDANGVVQSQLADGLVHGGTTAMFRGGSSSSTPAFYMTNSSTGPAGRFENSGTGHGLQCDVVSIARTAFIAANLGGGNAIGASGNLLVSGTTTLIGIVSATDAGNDICGVKLAATGLALIMIDTTYNLPQYIKAIGATTSGAESMGPGTADYKTLDGLTTAVSGTADSSGNRVPSYNL